MQFHFSIIISLIPFLAPFDFLFWVPFNSYYKHFYLNYKAFYLNLFKIYLKYYGYTTKARN